MFPNCWLYPMKIYSFRELCWFDVQIKCWNIITMWVIQEESHDNSKIQTTKWLTTNGKNFFFVVKFKLEKHLFRIVMKIGKDTQSPDSIFNTLIGNQFWFQHLYHLKMLERKRKQIKSLYSIPAVILSWAKWIRRTNASS